MYSPSEVADNLENGPFITVVSVDGGNNFGNKLTVITPIDGAGSCHPSPNSIGTDYGFLASAYDLYNSAELLQTLRNSEITFEESGYNNQNESSNGAAYVTVLSLGKDKSQLNAGDRKSIVNIFNETDGAFLNDEQFFDTANKNLQQITEPQESGDNTNKTRRRHRSVVCIEEKHPEVIENVTIYRLPGERLGFGLKFDSGSDAIEVVKRLNIQSCTPGSPAARAEASWGLLQEGDEILEIENVPVYTLSRADCIQALKDAPVAVNLLVRHLYSPDEIQLITRAKVLSSSDFVINCSDSDWTSQVDSLSPDSQAATNNNSESHLDVDGNEAIKVKYSINSSESAYESNSPLISDIEYEVEAMNYESATRLANELVLEIENTLSKNFAHIIDSFPISPPKPIPRKRSKSGARNNSVVNDHSSQPVDNKLDVKPPAEYDDTKNDTQEDLNQNETQHLLSLIHSFSKDIVSVPEASCSTLCDIDDGDGTASTRSTVISRLSLASYHNVSGFPDFQNPFLQCSSFNNTGTDGMTNLNSLIKHVESSSVHQNNSYFCPEEREKLATKRSKSSVGLVSVREGDAEVPLEPPLCFQDAESPYHQIMGNDPVFHPTKSLVRRSRSLVNIEYSEPKPRDCISANGHINTESEEEFNNNTNEDLVQMYADNNDLACSDRELGQESDYIFMKMKAEKELRMNGSDEDSKVRIRIEWLHEVEEEVNALEIDPFPSVQVIPKDMKFMEDHCEEILTNSDNSLYKSDELEPDTNNLQLIYGSHYCEIEHNNYEEMGDTLNNTVNNLNLSPFKEELFDNSNQTILTEESLSLEDYENCEKVKVIEVLVKNQLQWTQEIEPNSNGLETIEVGNKDITVQYDEVNSKNSPSPIVKRRNQKKPTMKEMIVELPENHNNIHPVKNSMQEIQDLCTHDLRNEIKGNENETVNLSIGLDEKELVFKVCHPEERMLNQILFLRPLPVATIQTDMSPSLVPVRKTHDEFTVVIEPLFVLMEKLSFSLLF